MKPFRLEGWTVLPDRNQVCRGRTVRELQPLEMELLLRLVEGQGEVVSKEELLRDVWGDRCVVEHVVPKTVSTLRKLLDESARDPRLIQTIPRKGYRLTCVAAEASTPARWRPSASLAAVLLVGSLVMPGSGGRPTAVGVDSAEAVAMAQKLDIEVRIELNERYEWRFDDGSEVPSDRQN